MTMTTVDILIGARRMVSNEFLWCQNAQARTYNGDPCGLTDSVVHSRCASAALWTVATQGSRSVDDAVYSDTYIRAASFLHSGIEDHTGRRCSVVNFNDHPTTTHQDVLDAFDFAIARARRAAER